MSHPELVSSSSSAWRWLALMLPGRAGRRQGGHGAPSSDAPISPGRTPGTTIEVGWTVVRRQRGAAAQPAAVRRVCDPPRPAGRRRARSRLSGEESSGQRRPLPRPTVVVPAGGIARVEVGLRGASCGPDQCGQMDIILPLTDDVLVTASSAIVTASGTELGHGSSLVPIVLMGADGRAARGARGYRHRTAPPPCRSSPLSDGGPGAGRGPDPRLRRARRHGRGGWHCQSRFRDERARAAGPGGTPGTRSRSFVCRIADRE